MNSKYVRKARGSKHIYNSTELTGWQENRDSEARQTQGAGTQCVGAKPNPHTHIPRRRKATEVKGLEQARWLFRGLARSGKG